MANARISGIAAYIPEDRLTNDDLAKMVDTNDEWITTRVGIKERRILKVEGAGSSFLGIKAVNQLLEETGTKPEEVDLLICTTANPDYRFPSTASVISHECGMVNAYSYDISAACAGFIVGLQDANAYIKAGLYKKVIVVSAEKMSSMIDYTDRATCPLFGDGAGAALVEPTEEETGVMGAEFHVDGVGLPNLVMKAGGSVKPTTQETLDTREHYLYQEGRQVYRHAVTDMYKATESVMKKFNLTVDDVDYLIPHQANLRIIEAVGSRLGIPEEKVLVNIENVGNTSSASIPICLNDFKHKLKKGDKLLLTAFGAGFTWGTLYLIWDI